MARWIVALAAAALALSVVGAPASAQDASRMRQRLAALDTNGDGAVSRAEANASREAMFNRLDTDGDGMVSLAENRAYRQRSGNQTPNPPARLPGDADGDGSWSLEEYLALPFALFDRADANQDGIVDAQEIASAQPPNAQQ